MTIEISTALSAARLQAVLDQLDAGAGPARLRLYAEPRTALGAAITATLLAEVALAEPSGVMAGGELTLSAPAVGTVTATGTPAWGVFVNGDGAPCLSAPVVALAPGDTAVAGAICLQVPVLYAGGEVRALSLTLG